MKSLIFVVDSQPGICESARKCLEAAGYAVQTFPNLESSQANPEHPSLLVIGAGLQAASAVTNQFSGSSHVDGIPRILLLDSNSAEHRLIAINSADDYLEKPFRPRELAARVQAVLRRSTASGAAMHNAAADIVIDSWAMKLLVRGTEVPTTTLEFRLMEYLAQHRGQVFTRDFLLDAVWGNMRFVNPRSVDACIRRIREKIEPDHTRPTLLKTVRGIGYRLDASATWKSAPHEVCGCLACTTKVTALRMHPAGSMRRRTSASAD